MWSWIKGTDVPREPAPASETRPVTYDLSLCFFPSDTVNEFFVLFPTNTESSVLSELTFLFHFEEMKKPLSRLISLL